MAHSINEQLMVSHFSEQQRRVLDLILRLSWGCGTKVAYIPRQRDFEIVGIYEGHIKAHLDWLIEAKVITREGCYYQFNKDFDQWRVSRASGYSQKKLTEIVRLNLNHDKSELTEKVNKNLRKGEETTYGKGKDPTSKIATPKERLNKYNKKGNYSSITNKKAMLVGLAYRKKKAELGRELTTEEKVQIAIEVDKKMEQEPEL